MPHQVLWTIAYRPDQVSHTLEIYLDANVLKRGLSTSPYSLQISFPGGTTFSFFKTVSGDVTFEENWGHSVDIALNRRYYAVEYKKLLELLPDWDKKTTIQLRVTTQQPGAWRGNPPTLEYEDLKIVPQVDGHICIHLPVGGWWSTGCCKILSFLHQSPYRVESERYPCVSANDKPVPHKSRPEVTVYLSATGCENQSITRLKVQCDFCWLYRLLTGREIGAIVVGIIIVILLFAWQFKWLHWVWNFITTLSGNK